MGTKGWVSSPSEEKLTDPGGPGPYLRMAGSGRGPVVGPSPRRRLCPRHRKSGGHLRPAKPGHGGRIRQRLGWEKVCGTAWSGVRVLKGGSGGYTLPSHLDHFSVAWTKRSTYSTAWTTPGHACVYSYQYGRGAAVGPQSCDSIWNGVMGLWGRGRAPSDTLVLSKGGAFGSEPQPVRGLWIILSMA